MKIIVLKVLAALLVCGSALAHEGHDHDGPVKVQAPKGGMIKMLEETYVEVVNKGSTFKVYLYDKELTPQDPKGYTISATAKKPRTKKADDVKLEVKDTYLEGIYDAKGAHRYTLTLSVKDPKENHGDKIKFTIEPKK